ncbi:hypothetical protein ABIE18_004461 [Arthrobacter sp. 2762]
MKDPQATLAKFYSYLVEDYGHRACSPGRPKALLR